MLYYEILINYLNVILQQRDLTYILRLIWIMVFAFKSILSKSAKKVILILKVVKIFQLKAFGA